MILFGFFLCFTLRVMTEVLVDLQMRLELPQQPPHCRTVVHSGHIWSEIFCGFGIGTTAKEKFEVH